MHRVRYDTKLWFFQIIKGHGSKWHFSDPFGSESFLVKKFDLMKVISCVFDCARMFSLCIFQGKFFF